MYSNIQDLAGLPADDLSPLPHGRPDRARGAGERTSRADGLTRFDEMVVNEWGRSWENYGNLWGKHGKIMFFMIQANLPKWGISKFISSWLTLKAWNHGMEWNGMEWNGMEWSSLSSAKLTRRWDLLSRQETPSSAARSMTKKYEFRFCKVSLRRSL